MITSTTMAVRNSPAIANPAINNGGSLSAVLPTSPRGDVTTGDCIAIGAEFAGGGGG